MAGKGKTKNKGKTKTETETGTAVDKRSRQEVVRAAIKTAQTQIEESYIDLAQLMSEAYHKEFYIEWGHSTFEDYCQNELDIKYRKARYFVDIWDKVKSLDLPKDRVSKLGWTKMRDIASVIDEKNAKEWLDKAEKMTTREVEEAVKISRKKDTSGSSVPAIVTMTFRMSETEANVITDALNEAKKLSESDEDVTALEMICQDWLFEKGEHPAARSLSEQIEYLGKVYGVDIEFKVTKQGETQTEKAEEVIKKADKKGKTDKKAESDETPEDGVTADEDSVDIDELLGI